MNTAHAIDPVMPPQQARARAYREFGPLDESEAQLVNSAQRILMAALDHSRAPQIVLVPDVGTAKEKEDYLKIELPVSALRVISKVLGLMGQRKPFALIPREHMLTTQEAANILNVSRPFVVKEIHSGNIRCDMAGSHRRIPYSELMRYREAMRDRASLALQSLADDAQELGLGYK